MSVVVSAAEEGIFAAYHALLEPGRRSSAPSNGSPRVLNRAIPAAQLVRKVSEHPADTT